MEDGVLQNGVTMKTRLLLNHLFLQSRTPRRIESARRRHRPVTGLGLALLTGSLAVFGVSAQPADPRIKAEEATPTIQASETDGRAPLPSRCFVSRPSVPRGGEERDCHRNRAPVFG